MTLSLTQSWNAALASMAATWAAGCDFRHGQPPIQGDPPFSAIGQNLYAGSGRKTISLTSAIQLWYDEKVDYDYDTLSCVPGKMCGHYTQVGRQRLLAA